MNIRILITLSGEQVEALDALMKEDYQPTMYRSAYFGYLIAQETKRRREVPEDGAKRPPGRPRKDGLPAGTTRQDIENDFPDEHEERTLPLPEEYKPYVLPKDRAKLVNAYDLEMLQAKKENHEATQG